MKLFRSMSIRTQIIILIVLMALLPLASSFIPLSIRNSTTSGKR